MMEVITYSLRDGHKNSEAFCQDVAVFADEVLAEADGRVGGVLEAFEVFLQQTEREILRSRSEYAFELLTLGTFWRVYAPDALNLSRASQRALAFLARLRRQGGALKPAADLLRGVLGSLFLSAHSRRLDSPPTPSLDNLDRLLDWLEAACDFRQELKRLRAWRAFLARQASEQIAETLRAAVDLAGWFEPRAQAVLGRYTPNVERFLGETHPSYRWREAEVFCGRRRVEYHLNMIGTEILNSAYRAAFLGTARKLVLVPPCMKAQSDDKCQAHPTPYGALCADCTPGCRVHQLTKLGEKHGFEVLIMPHELSVFSNGGLKPVASDAVGVVGVSCVLTNPAGGWETKDLGVPAQGVLLDYCGCGYHWHKAGFPTDINIAQLLRVLGVSTHEG
jgi:hypothetical protein